MSCFCRIERDINRLLVQTSSHTHTHTQSHFGLGHNIIVCLSFLNFVFLIICVCVCATARYIDKVFDGRCPATKQCSIVAGHGARHCDFKQVVLLFCVNSSETCQKSKSNAYFRSEIDISEAFKPAQNYHAKDSGFAKAQHWHLSIVHASNRQASQQQQKCVP